MNNVSLKRQKPTITKRQFSDKNIAKFNNQLSKESWDIAYWQFHTNCVLRIFHIYLHVQGSRWLEMCIASVFLGSVDMGQSTKKISSLSNLFKVLILAVKGLF